jgi:hypothetical protein
VAINSKLNHVGQHEQDDYDERYTHQPKNDRHDKSPLSVQPCTSVNTHAMVLFRICGQDLSDQRSLSLPAVFLPPPRLMRFSLLLAGDWLPDAAMPPEAKSEMGPPLWVAVSRRER